MKRIYITGPECSGKSTLAKALAQSLEIPCIPEFARTYLTLKESPYGLDDLQFIAHQQVLLQEVYDILGSEMIVCDTGPLVLKIWAEEAFLQVPVEIQRYLAFSPDLAILCRPDFPWVADPLREHPHDRERLYAMYRSELVDLNWHFHEVEGGPQVRLEDVLKLVKEM